jgi:hypothetical protein
MDMGMASLKVRPGLRGYIDESSRWKTVIDLTDSESILQRHYFTLDPIKRMRPTKRYWGPKAASSVNRKETHLEAGVLGSNNWTDPEHHVEIGVKVGATGIRNVGP